MKRREHTVYTRQNTRYTLNSSTPTANSSAVLDLLSTTSPETESATTINTNDSSPDAAVRINSSHRFDAGTNTARRNSESTLH